MLTNVKICNYFYIPIVYPKNAPNFVLSLIGTAFFEIR